MSLEADQVKMAKIQLTDVARTWWLAEEVKLGDNITWKQFSDSFYESFFPDSAKKDMEEQFIRLRQWDNTVDAYAADFRRLSRFASYMVADEEKRASRFQQGLKLDIQIPLIPQRLKTYSDILISARDLERALNIKNRGKVQQGQQKRPFQ